MWYPQSRPAYQTGAVEGHSFVVWLCVPSALSISMAVVGVKLQPSKQQQKCIIQESSRLASDGVLSDAETRFRGRAKVGVQVGGMCMPLV